MALATGHLIFEAEPQEMQPFVYLKVTKLIKDLVDGCRCRGQFGRIIGWRLGQVRTKDLLKSTIMYSYGILILLHLSQCGLIMPLVWIKNGKMEFTEPSTIPIQGCVPCGIWYLNQSASSSRSDDIFGCTGEGCVFSILGSSEDLAIVVTGMTGIHPHTGMTSVRPAGHATYGSQFQSLLSISPYMLKAYGDAFIFRPIKDWPQ